MWHTFKSSFNLITKPLSTVGKYGKAEGLWGMKEITGGADLRREGFFGERWAKRNKSWPCQGGARPGWGREVRVSRDEGISAKPPRPRAALAPRLPTCGSPSATIPQPRPGCTLPARRLHIRYTGGSGAAGEGKGSGARRGPKPPGCRSGSPRHRVKVRPDAGRQLERKAAEEVRTCETAAPTSPPTPRPPPVPHTGCTASSTREWCAPRGAQRTSSWRFPFTPTRVQQLQAAAETAAAATTIPTPPHMGPGAARRCASLLLRRRRGLLRAALPPSSSSYP